MSRYTHPEQPVRISPTACEHARTMRRALLLALLVALAGCGDDGVVDGAPARPALAVSAALSLDDAGQTTRDRFAFAVRLTPPDAELRARAGRGAIVSVEPGRDGENVVRVRRLRPGATRVTLRATAAGAAPWTGRATVRRTG